MRKRNKGKKFTWTDEAQVSQKNKRELCEAPVLGMPTEKGIFFVRYGCISCCDIGQTSPGARVEWENGSPSDSPWK